MRNISFSGQIILALTLAELPHPNIGPTRSAT
jgi:hypothetical protein